MIPTNYCTNSKLYKNHVKYVAQDKQYIMPTVRCAWGKCNSDTCAGLKGKSYMIMKDVKFFKFPKPYEELV